MSHHDEQPMDELEQAAADEYAAEVERGGKRWAIGIGVAIAIIVGLFVWRGSNSEASSEELRDDATRACQEEFIPKRLKAPATAEFSNVSVAVTGETYTVAGAVDSQNGFGALVRSSFSCTMHANGETWVLDGASVS